jgi:hypothetical protein
MMLQGILILKSNGNVEVPPQVAPQILKNRVPKRHDRGRYGQLRIPPKCFIPLGNPEIVHLPITILEQATYYHGSSQERTCMKVPIPLDRDAPLTSN